MNNKNPSTKPQSKMTEPQKTEPTLTPGIITDCPRLNIRQEPNMEADILCTIPCLSEVMIDETLSTEDFYRICTASGIEGYCVKKFIAVPQ